MRQWNRQKRNLTKKVSFSKTVFLQIRCFFIMEFNGQKALSSVYQADETNSASGKQSRARVRLASINESGPEQPTPNPSLRMGEQSTEETESSEEDSLFGIYSYEDIVKLVQEVIREEREKRRAARNK